MERRAFLQLLGIGMGFAATLGPARALNLASRPVASPDAQNPTPAIATPDDLERAEVDKIYYGHWRRVNRRVNRRVARRVYRRHYYY